MLMKPAKRSNTTHYDQYSVCETMRTLPSV